MAGDTGTRSRGGFDSACGAAHERPGLARLDQDVGGDARARIGMSDSDSTRLRARRRHREHDLVVRIGDSLSGGRAGAVQGVSGNFLGNWGRRLTSRPRSGRALTGPPAENDGVHVGRRPGWCARGARAHERARSTARASFSTVPDLQNGVRQPAITARASVCSWHYILLDVGPHP